MKPGWTEVALGDVCDIQIGKTPPRENGSYWGGDHPWLSISDMNQGRSLSVTSERITTKAVQDLNCRVVPAGTVLLSFKLSIGKVGITSIPMYTNEAIAHLPISVKYLDPTYLYWALRTVPLTGGADRAAMGSTLNKSKVAKIRFPLPPLEEQKRIAAILDKADELLAKRRAAIAHLDSLTQAIFLDMFGDPVSAALSERVALGDHVDFMTSGSRGWARFYSSTGAMFLRIQNVLRDKLDLADVAFVQPPDTAETRRTRLQAGDVLMSITADLGRSCVVSNEAAGGFMNQHLCLIRTRSFEPRFLSAFLSSPGAVGQIRQRNKGGVKAGLNFDDVRSLQVPGVSRDSQVEFVHRAARIDAAMHCESAAFVESGRMVESLQSRAFRGEL